ncbi:hypothetical protein DICVIV_13516 [Dictyocaulus viviparus]|uniref:Uncharacterized protein n=1 Tax=Dictyocaulus viviparus TaxID=29172 RepID=A0A0D8X7L3_DICVI|nr:hypothetical protein DICVIV_13516 [Dictyocaulus viviparus]
MVIVLRAHHRGSSERFLSLTPALQASTVSIVMLVLLASVIILFLVHEYSSFLAMLLSLVQILYSCSAFLFAGYVFRMRFLYEREDGPPHMTERKRDISRALLDHGDAVKNNVSGTPKNSVSDTYLGTSQNLYDSAPMVSIV